MGGIILFLALGVFMCAGLLIFEGIPAIIHWVIDLLEWHKIRKQYYPKHRRCNVW